MQNEKSMYLVEYAEENYGIFEDHDQNHREINTKPSDEWFENYEAKLTWLRLRNTIDFIQFESLSLHD